MGINGLRYLAMNHSEVFTPRVQPFLIRAPIELGFKWGRISVLTAQPFGFSYSATGVSCGSSSWYPFSVGPDGNMCDGMLNRVQHKHP